MAIPSEEGKTSNPDSDDAGTARSHGASDEKEPESEEVPSADASWRVRPEWQGQEIPEHNDLERRDKQNAAGWGCMAFFLIIPILMSALLWYEGLVIPAFVMALVAFTVVWFALSMLLPRQRGPIAFEMDEMPARLGGRLTGTVRVENWGGEPTRPEFSAFLSCYESKSRRSLKENLRWQAEARVKGSLRKAAGQMEIPISFQLPETQPPATPAEEEGRIMWALEVEAPPLKEPFLFELPVLEPEISSASDEAESTSLEDPPTADRGKPQVQDAESPETEFPETESETEDGGRSSRLPIQDKASVGGMEVEVETSAGVPSSVDIRASLGGTAVFLFVLGGGMVVGGLLVAPTGFFGLLILTVGLGILYAAWKSSLCHTSIAVVEDEVQILHTPPRPLPGASTETIPRSNVIDVRVTDTRGGSLQYQHGVELLYDYEESPPVKSAIESIRERDVETERQGPLLLPDGTMPVLVKVGKVSSLQEAERLASIIREVVM